MNAAVDDSHVLLRIEQLSKRYAVTVLDRVSLDIRAGEIHALIGANGAGKSTLSRIIAGLTPASEGHMQLAGKPFLPKNKKSAELAGVQIVQQELNLLPTLTVAENIFLNRLPSHLGCINFPLLHQQARQALDQFGLTDIETNAPVSSLGVGQQQMVEIAATLCRESQLLILDEPTAALSTAEVEKLFEQLKQLRQPGLAIIYISHRLDEIAELTDRVSILRDGRLLTTQPTASTTTDQMVEYMTGDDGSSPHNHVDHRTQQIAFQVENLSNPPHFSDVSITVHQGERLGIAGLVGSGRTELLRAIFGADIAQSGKVSLTNDQIPDRFQHPSQATKAGFAMVTEDRKQNGLLLTQSIVDNTTLSSLSQFSALGMIQQQNELKAVQRQVRDLDIRCQSLQQTVGQLSGGNQQKVAIAKWLQRDASVFLFDEPTRGIDVGARRRIYQLLDSLAAAGKALVIVSSDTDELMQICDSIAVMSAGRLVATFQRPNWSISDIQQAAFQGYLNPTSS